MKTHICFINKKTIIVSAISQYYQTHTNAFDCVAKCWAVSFWSYQQTLCL